MAQRAQRPARRRPCDLPLPGPVWTISSPFSIGLGRDLGVLHRLALRHLRLVAAASAASLGHLGFTLHRQAGDHEDHAVGDGGNALLQPAGLVAEAPGQRVVGHDAEPDLVGDQHDGARGPRAGLEQARRSGSRVVLRQDAGW